MFKVCEINEVSNIDLFNLSSTERVKLKLNFQKTKVVRDKTVCFVIGPFRPAHSICPNIDF